MDSKSNNMNNNQRYQNQPTVSMANNYTMVPHTLLQQATQAQGNMMQFPGIVPNFFEDAFGLSGGLNLGLSTNFPTTFPAMPVNNYLTPQQNLPNQNLPFNHFTAANINLSMPLNFHLPGAFPMPLPEQMANQYAQQFTSNSASSSNQVANIKNEIKTEKLVTNTKSSSRNPSKRRKLSPNLENLENSPQPKKVKQDKDTKLIPNITTLKQLEQTGIIDSRKFIIPDPKDPNPDPTTKNKLYLCCICNKSYKRSDLRRRHVIDVHTDLVRHVCGIDGCEFRAYRTDHLASHRRNKHGCHAGLKVSKSKSSQ